jgi:hypothetical protein
VKFIQSGDRWLPETDDFSIDYGHALLHGRIILIASKSDKKKYLPI